eukprot:3695313-Rhodomonas_salina.1
MTGKPTVAAASAFVLADLPVPVRDRWVSYRGHWDRLKWCWDRCSTSILLLRVRLPSLPPSSFLRVRSQEPKP